MPIRLDELRDALVDQLGLLEIDHMLSEASLNRAINAGLRRMAREMDWPWLQEYETIAFDADDTEIDLPDGAIRVSSVSVGSDPLFSASLNDMIAVDGESGTADRFRVKGDKIRIAPTPALSGSAVVVFVLPEPVLVDDDDTTLAPDHYEDIIVLYAAKYQATRLKDAEMYRAVDNDLKEAIRAIHKDAITTSRVPPIKLRDDF